MDKLDNMIDKLKKFQNNTSEIIKGIITANQSIIVDMNTQDQLFEKGIDNKGTKLDSYHPYRQSTIKIKQMKGQPTNRVTLRDTGEFQSSFYLDIKDDSFEIKASDRKTSELMRNYSPDIFGLTDQNMNEISEHYIKPKMIEILSQ
jgi:hypothetical protein